MQKGHHQNTGMVQDTRGAYQDPSDSSGMQFSQLHEPSLVDAYARQLGLTSDSSNTQMAYPGMINPSTYQSSLGTITSQSNAYQTGAMMGASDTTAFWDHGSMPTPHSIFSSSQHPFSNSALHPSSSLQVSPSHSQSPPFGVPTTVSPFIPPFGSPSDPSFGDFSPSVMFNYNTTQQFSNNQYPDFRLSVPSTLHTSGAAQQSDFYQSDLYGGTSSTPLFDPIPAVPGGVALSTPNHQTHMGDPATSQYLPVGDQYAKQDSRRRQRQNATRYMPYHGFGQGSGNGYGSGSGSAGASGPNFGWTG